MMKRLYNFLRGSILHPQWLTDRHHLRARRLLRPLRDALVLDIGSGDSHSERYLHASNRLVRLDYPEVNRRYTLRPDIYGDARNLPIADSALDAALLLEVLEHIDEHEPVLREIRRALRPGGKLFISVPFLYPIHDAPHDFYRFTVHGLRHILERAGLDVVYERQHGNGFVVAIQMWNMALLETCKIALKKNRFFGLLLAALTYPLVVLSNLIASPFTLLPNRGAGAFGYFVVAQRT